MINSSAPTKDLLLTRSFKIVTSVQRKVPVGNSGKLLEPIFCYIPNVWLTCN